MEISHRVFARAKGCWTAMRQRCLDSRQPMFAYYGGRGIRVCAAWLTSYAAFFADMGPRPIGSSLDRIDNNRGYEPENCRWATRKEQSMNTSRTVRMTLRGRTAGIAEWSEELGIKKSTISRRLYLGWTPERALTQPVRAVTARSV